MIIGLIGQAGSGKNTFAERLKLFSLLPVDERSFADKLKKSAAASLGISVEVLESIKNTGTIIVGDPKKTVFGKSSKPITEISIRSFLQKTGTEAHRDIFGDSFWLDAALPLTENYPKTRLTVITDPRFPNEAKRIEELGGITIKIFGAYDKDYELVKGEWLDIQTGEPGHSSETSLLDYEVDFVVNNNVRGDDFVNLDKQVAGIVMQISEETFQMSSKEK